MPSLATFAADARALGFGTDAPISGADAVDLINRHFAALAGEG